MFSVIKKRNGYSIDSKQILQYYIKNLIFCFFTLSRKTRCITRTLILWFNSITKSKKGIRVEFRGLNFSTEGEKTKIRV